MLGEMLSFGAGLEGTVGYTWSSPSALHLPGQVPHSSGGEGWLCLFLRWDPLHVGQRGACWLPADPLAGFLHEGFLCDFD